MISQDSQENTTVLEFIFKFILRFILVSILMVSSREFWEICKRIFFTEQIRTTASAVGLLIYYRYVKHLDSVITRYYVSFSTQIVSNRSFNLF